MNILCIDIGKGTQDILYFDTEKNVENSIKLILPSPTTIISRKIKKLKENLRIDGDIMGGGPVAFAIMQKLKQGYSVEISENCAKTIRDDLDEVRAKGITIKENIGDPNVYLKDLDFEMLNAVFSSIGIDFSPNSVCVACQDHGFMKGQSDRITRFKYFEKKLNETNNPYEFYFDNKKYKTENFSRFESVLKILDENKYKGFVMDSKMASVCGILNYAVENNINEFIGLDIGNGHTLGVSIANKQINGLFEHHTGLIDAEKLKGIVEKMSMGLLKNEEIYADNGHGACVNNKTSPENIYISGPNRELFKQYGNYAYPGGDVMITGCIGLLDVYRYKK
ncbi:Domain of unkown function DUF1786 putative pyruvate format-lyase activating enzyme [Methanococcus vannielii SB]|uniref:Domain of unkown function DUF1786 putative pyruvate format-lyase activating enzyme n=1 Tax=Methanococcus vannielii (strain ATCC 35089 / DSM 1224 / JCM 13029 / OCM 148 / SB) TaxID=406327 RepID=A6UPR6_METVS|nr:DUF1786 domain-containing protein [Methanococcus vannielii]ABR54488.1 Domain of unkown function DUF1786 putative pyruvate format-lyase activating enzyme [Methanococcus vannielii SB]